MSEQEALKQRILDHIASIKDSNMLKRIESHLLEEIGWSNSDLTPSELASLERAQKDIEAGRIRDHSDVMHRLRAKIGSRQP